MDYASIFLRIIGSKKNQELFGDNREKNSNKKRIMGPSFVEVT